jgi:hypothetical protein
MKESPSRLLRPVGSVTIRLNLSSKIKKSKSGVLDIVRSRKNNFGALLCKSNVRLMEHYKATIVEVDIDQVVITLVFRFLSINSSFRILVQTVTVVFCACFGKDDYRVVRIKGSLVGFRLGQGLIVIECAKRIVGAENKEETIEYTVS